MNVPLFKVHMPESVMGPLKETLLSGYIGQGPKVEEFERALIPWMGTPNVLSVITGTAALRLAMRLAGVGPGTEVVTSPCTCVATNTPILEQYGDIVWGDIDPWTGSLDPVDVERKITSKTKAIVCIHWGGYPCDMDELVKISKKYGVALIQDAAHAFGAIYHNRPIGALSCYSCFRSSTRVMTDKGRKKICKIVVGDRVVASDGRYHRVMQVHRRPYKGYWTRVDAGQLGITATSEHPIKVYRNGADRWLPAGEVKIGDCVYVLTKKCDRCPSLVPIYGRICERCYLEANSSIEKRQKVQTARAGRNKKSPSTLKHYYRDVFPVMKEYMESGYRVIPMAMAIPDFIAIKDNKIKAVEVESGTSIRLGKKDKYDKLKDTPYDDVVWITRQKKREYGGRHTYEIVGHLARVPVAEVHHYEDMRQRIVYNLAVEDDPTYFAAGILVHNCFSLQAIKHLTTSEGGLLVCPTAQGYREGKLLRWYGIDRETSRVDMRCEEDIISTGYKYNFSDVCATIGLEQLKYVKGILDRHRANATFYDKALNGLKRVKRLRYKDDRLSSYWLYTIRVDDRESFQAHMAKNGIMVSQVHVRNDIHTAFKAYRRNLPGVDEFAAQQVSIPVGWWVTDEDREKIVKATQEWDVR